MKRQTMLMIEMLLLAALPALVSAANDAPSAPGADEVREIERSARELRAEDARLRQRLHELAQRGEEFSEVRAALVANVEELSRLERIVGPEVRRVIEQTLVFDDRPLLGLSIDSSSADGAAVDGVGVLAVTPGGPAEAAGIESGDTILRFADTELAAESAREANALLLAELAEVDAGEPVALVVSRDGKEMPLEVTPTRSFAHRWRVPLAPGAPPAPGPGERHFEFELHGGQGFDFVMSDAERQWEGIELVELTPALGRYFGADAGLLVVRKPIDGNLPLEEGDVIRRIGDRSPASVSQAMRILRSYDAGEELIIEILREKKPQTLSMTIPAAG